MTKREILYIIHKDCTHIERVINSCETLEQLESVADWINFLFHKKYSNMFDKLIGYFTREEVQEEISEMWNIVNETVTTKNNELLPGETVEAKRKYPPITVVKGYC